MYLNRRGMGDFTTPAQLALVGGAEVAAVGKRIAQWWFPEPPPANIVAPPGAPQTSEQMTNPTAWSPDAAIAAGAAQTRANIREFFASLPSSDTSESDGGSGWMLWAALLVGGIAAIYVMRS